MYPAQAAPYEEKTVRVLGIVAEYNPFTNGHAYHLRESRRLSRADFVVAVMSGDFTQRGEPAILDKWTRAEMALRSGVDLVIELPVAFAVNSAEHFAKGAVGILEALGVVDSISFGSESGDLDDLREAADIMDPGNEAFEAGLKEGLDKGLSYGAASEYALASVIGKEKATILANPNNILAVEYLKAVKTMIPYTVKRAGSGYLDPDKKTDGSRGDRKESTDETAELISAMGVRNRIFGGEGDFRAFMPKEAGDIMAENIQIAVSADDDTLFGLVRSAVLSRSEDELKDIYGMEEGIENRIVREVRRNDSYEKFTEMIRSRRFPMSRVQRLLVNCLLGRKKDEVYNKTNYARILGFTGRGSELLRVMQKEAGSHIEIVTNMNKFRDETGALRLDIRANDIYNIISGRDLYLDSDFVRKPVMV